MSLPGCSVLAQADVSQNKTHRFSDWNIFGKHFFPVWKISVCVKPHFSERKVICLLFFLGENVQSIQHANMFTYTCVCV